MEKVIKTFVSQIRSVNVENKTLEAVISDETIDRYGEVISIDAWKKRLKRYKENPVLLSSHRYDKLTNQIGEAERVYVDGNQLIAKFKYYAGEGNEEADWGWKLASKFGRAAYSVGFLPYSSDEADEKDYDDVKTGKKARRTYKDVELLEVSHVLIPANPSARLKSLEDETDEVFKEYAEMVTKDLEKEIEEKSNTQKEEEMKEILDAINKLSEKVDALQKQIEEKEKKLEEKEIEERNIEAKLEEEAKAAEEAAKKALEEAEAKAAELEAKKLEEEKKAKEEEENYIKTLMEEMNGIVTKVADKISVQS